MSTLVTTPADLTALGFHGSYQAEDVTFLLQLSQVEPIDVQQKEQLIQSGQKHYSQMISQEAPPSNQHWQYYQYALSQSTARLSQDIQALAHSLQRRFQQTEIVLVSLVRAGVPLGVLLKHCIAKDQPCVHYAISIIRDRGIDIAALQAIIEVHGAESIVFVDGWTGKGAICQELTQSVKHYPALFDEGYDIPRLVTLTDLGGYAWLSASCDDWLIPFGMLGGVISGLTSRSLLLQDIDPILARQNPLNTQYWHQCMLYSHLSLYDQSRDFITKILMHVQQHPVATDSYCHWSEQKRLQQQSESQAVLDWIQSNYQIEDVNRIKPGLAEATRAVLRRVPERILVKDLQHPHLKLILHFAKQHGINVEVSCHLGPYLAITIIKKMRK